jgi:hypothetical protein
LCLGNIGELHWPFAEMVRKMLHGADGVAGFLGQHGWLLRRMACFFNPASRQSNNSLNFVPKFCSICVQMLLHCMKRRHSVLW